MDEEFIRNRITELRLKKGVSEYQMSMDLGQNKNYVQAISSGRALPSMKQFLNICEYMEITPFQFFDAHENNPQLIKKALDGMRKLSDDDLIMLIGLIGRLNSESYREHNVASNAQGGSVKKFVSLEENDSFLVRITI